jgi:hypothetical protein
VKWNVRTVDWVAGVAMSVVLLAGGSFALGAWGDLSTVLPASEGTSDSEGAVGTSSSNDPDQDSDAGDEEKPAGSDEDAKVTGSGKDDGPSAVENQQLASASSLLVLSSDSEPPPPALADPVDFVVSSFNVLGSSHTGGGSRYAAGPTRARYAAQLVLSHHVEIVGFQELQRNQMNVLNGIIGDRYAMFPGASMSERDSVNSIAWDMTKWEATDSSTVTIPYFRGSPRQMPLVRLQNRANGAEIWVGNFHNPASPPGMGDNERWRARATQIEITTANDLIRRDKIPVVFTGDFNEREDVFCPVATQTPLVASNGGSGQAGCHPPAQMNVDWVFGSDIEWLDHLTDRSSLVQRTTDHPMVVATGLLQPPGGSSAAAEAAEAMARAQQAEGN